MAQKTRSIAHIRKQKSTCTINHFTNQRHWITTMFMHWRICICHCHDENFSAPRKRITKPSAGDLFGGRGFGNDKVHATATQCLLMSSWAGLPRISLKKQCIYNPCMYSGSHKHLEGNIPRSAIRILKHRECGLHTSGSLYAHSSVPKCNVGLADLLAENANGTSPPLEGSKPHS